MSIPPNFPPPMIGPLPPVTIPPNILPTLALVTTAMTAWGPHLDAFVPGGENTAGAAELAARADAVLKAGPEERAGRIHELIRRLRNE
jgi:hypothetical protein